MSADRRWHAELLELLIVFLIQSKVHIHHATRRSNASAAIPSTLVMLGAHKTGSTFTIDR